MMQASNEFTVPYPTAKNKCTLAFHFIVVLSSLGPFDLAQRSTSENVVTNSPHKVPQRASKCEQGRENRNFVACFSWVRRRQGSLLNLLGVGESLIQLIDSVFLNKEGYEISL
jgi:hypothetical protein